MPDKNTAYVSPDIAGILSLFDPALDWSADLSGDEYATALKEFLVVHQEGSQDPRKDHEIETDVLQGIREEYNKVRKNKDLEYSVKKTKIKGNKFFDRDEGKGKAPDKSQNPDISQIFNTESIKPADTDPESNTDQSSVLIPKRLDGIADSVESIATLLRRQLGLQEKQQRDAQVKQDQINKQDREDDLEKKPKDKKTLPKAIAKPALGFFERIKKFFLNIVIGAAAYKMLDWFKDPANAEKITQFKDFLVNNAPVILGSLAALAALPVILTVVKVIKGILWGLSLLGPLLPLLPWILGGLLIGAVAWWISKKLFGEKDRYGSQQIHDERRENVRRLREAGIATATEKKLEIFDEDDKLISAPLYGENSITGREWEEGDQFGRNKKVILNLLDPKHAEWYVANYGQEALDSKLASYTSFRETKAALISTEQDMKAELKEEKEKWEKKWNAKVEEAGYKGLATSRFDKKGHREITAAAHEEWRKKEEEIRRKYGEQSAQLGDQAESSLGITDNDQESSDVSTGGDVVQQQANIDTNVKQNTNVPGPPVTSNKGQTQVIPGGSGGQTQSGGPGSGSESSSTGVPKFSSVDVQNTQIISTQAQYNKVTVD